MPPRPARPRSRRTARRSAPSTTSTTATPTTSARNYQALETMGNYDVRSNWTVGGHWTLQLKNEGNYEGEAANQPGSPRLLGDYPETAGRGAQLPDGPARRLPAAQGARVVDVSTRASAASASFDITPMWRYNSALTYSLARQRAAQRDPAARNPGYARLPGGGIADAVLRRARQRRVRGLRPGGSRRSPTRCRCGSTLGRGSSSKCSTCSTTTS